MSDIENILFLEQAGLSRDKEIARVLGCCEWDHFAILEINPLGIDLKDLANVVKKTYRRKTLLIHPDKTTNPQAPQAFDLLKKSELVLSQDVEQETNEVATQNLINEKKRLVAIYQAHGTANSGDFNDAANFKTRKLVAEILRQERKHEEIEKLYQQREEAAKDEENKKIHQQRELKRKLHSEWEDDRDVRVNNWRSYTNKVEKKKKKKKKNVLA